MWLHLEEKNCGIDLTYIKEYELFYNPYDTYVGSNGINKIKVERWTVVLYRHSNDYRSINFKTETEAKDFLKKLLPILNKLNSDRKKIESTLFEPTLLNNSDNKNNYDNNGSSWHPDSIGNFGLGGLTLTELGIL